MLDKLTGGTGLGGIAAASTAGNAAAVPVAVAAVIVTSILVPIITAWFSKRSDRVEAVKASAHL